jgi:thiol:disulfide interchange protein DsbD
MKYIKFTWLITKLTRKSLRFSLIAVLATIVWAQAGAQNFDSERDVALEMLSSASGIPAGGSMDVAVVLTVPRDYHITSLETGLFFVDFDTSTGLAFSDPLFPSGVEHEGDEVYQGVVVVRSVASAPEDALEGPLEIKAVVGYQVCVETGTRQCYFPVERDVSLSTTILPEGVSPTPMHTDVFSATSQGVTDATGEVRATSSGDGLAGSVASALEQGSLLALLLVFIGGILTSFTPCVYPIIPITVSYIGARAEGKKLRGFILSLFFVLGLALMYSTLGVIAALSGGVFGGLTQHPVVYGVLIAVFLAMGASMMGAFDLQLPASWQGKLQSGQRKGVVGAIFMGLAAGLIAAPCVGPVLVALLSWVAQTGSVIVGFGLLFTFSLGMGLLFVVIGTFAGAITALPQAGGWMDGVKHFFGWLLWGTAVYFASLIIPDTYMLLILGAFLSLLGIFIGAFRTAVEDLNWKWILRKWFGILAVTAGIFFFLFGLTQLVGWQPSAATGTASAVQNEPDWILNDVEGAFDKAAFEGKPLMMDFYADWCVACVELDHKTYNQPEVLSRAEKFVNLKMDFTSQDEWSRRMTEQYGVLGMPTVIFFDSEGHELQRFVGFKNARAVSEIMDAVLSENDQ